MTSKKVSKLRPESGMTRGEAEALASGLASQLEDMGRGGVEDFILLLRYLAYKATRDDAETIYILTEKEYAYHFAGVDEAVQSELMNALDALRQRRKGRGEV